MKCIYCNQDCIKTSDTINHTEHTCDNHEHTVYYRKVDRSDILMIVYNTSWNDERVIINIFMQPFENQMRFQLWVSMDLLLELETVPTTITPDNIDQKLPILITFS